MNQLFTRLSIKMAQNKIFSAFTDVKDSVVAQQPRQKKQTENAALQQCWGALVLHCHGGTPEWKTTSTNLGLCSDEHIHLLLDLTFTEGRHH